jgi:hypothetical protein
VVVAVAPGQALEAVAVDQAIPAPMAVLLLLVRAAVLPEVQVAAVEVAAAVEAPAA